ncbi:MAG: hypothetical protein ACKO8I_14530 [Cyanobacteriota bacterium]
MTLTVNDLPESPMPIEAAGRSMLLKTTTDLFVVQDVMPLQSTAADQQWPQPAAGWSVWR